MSQPDRAAVPPENCSSERCSAADAPASAGRCPLSGTLGWSVNLVTLEALLQPDALRRLDGASYCFCSAAACDAVYFDSETDSVFRKRDLTVRVGLKEQEHPIPLCYCFGYSLADIERDLAARGTTDIPDRITAEIRAGQCACEIRNPQGICCLGSVNAAVRTAVEALRYRRPSSA